MCKKLKQSQIKGIKFFYRENSSDEKTFLEVIGDNVYQKRGMKIEAGETWLDAGGNVGAFTLLACSLGVKKVITFEPDPFSFEILKKNIELNGFQNKVELHNKALVHNDSKQAFLFVGHKNMFWRNSLVKNWNGKGVKVECVKFEEVVPNNICAKIDIEGAEMLILENTQKRFKKMVFEWSLDIDGSLNRLRSLIKDKIEPFYDYDTDNNNLLEKADDFVPKNVIKKAINIYCNEKS